MSVESHAALVGLTKAPTAIAGFDEITYGGLPQGRPTLLCGSAGCGKTLFATEFLVRGVTAFGEPGVFVAFEEDPAELTKNMASLGFDLEQLQRSNMLRIDHVKVDRAEIAESGEYDLEGLFIRLNHFIDQIGAKRVVLDTIETVFAGLDNQAILRTELQRLFQWLREKGVTTVITAERGNGQLTRQGLEEYVSDCVVLLDHRVHDHISTRRLRIVKYRGSVHGTNEYPFLIDEAGFTVLPVTSLGLGHAVLNDRISIGVPDLDEMLGGGVYRGSSILLSGTSGSGKSSLAASFAAETCAKGGGVLYVASEESPGQIVRNMRSIGLDLQQWIDAGLLTFHANRPMHQGLELHLATFLRLVEKLKPAAVIVDPISNLETVGPGFAVTEMLVRVVDFLKIRGITGLLVNLTSSLDGSERTEVGLSSLMDTWILVRDIESDGERNRGVYVLKSRGTKHSNQIREFHITSNGIRLEDAYLGPDGVLTGSARIAQEARERQKEDFAVLDAQRRKKHAERKRRALEAQIAALQAEIEEEELESKSAMRDEESRVEWTKSSREEMAGSRLAHPPSVPSAPRPQP